MWAMYVLSLHRTHAQKETHVSGIRVMSSMIKSGNKLSRK